MIAAFTRTGKPPRLYKNHQPARMPDPALDTVEVRVLTALKTLRAVSDPDAKFLHQFEGRGISWPEVLRSEQESYGYDIARTKSFNPTPRDVSRMARIGRSDETARRRYKSAIKEVEVEAARMTLGID
jgi:hypothetical protein